MTIASPLRTQESLTTSREQFFELSDEVLREAGRPGLGAAMRAILEVRNSDVVLQILAGPGAGKTEVLVWRVLYELFVRGTDAARLIVTTFTRKAAQELGLRIVERSDALLEAAIRTGLPLSDPHVHDLRIGTVHSLCDQIMTEFDDEHQAVGAQVIDELETRLRLLRVRNWAFRDGSRQVLGNILAREELTCLFRPPWLDNTGNRLQQVDLALDILNQHVETWVPRCRSEGIPNGIEIAQRAKGLTADLLFIRERWKERLDQGHVMDYVLLQERFKERQANFASEFDHVFVDEFQDTNPIQYAIQYAIHTGWVSHGSVRLTVVGDDDQALYRWRGSDIACFANLEGDCEAAGHSYRREVLDVNHRSTANIVHFAQTFREKTVLASDSLPKTVRPPSDAQKGRPVRLLEGEWEALCKKVAEEAASLGAGRLPRPGGSRPHRRTAHGLDI
jgi:DNA helicase II / ATP-dependent DNA helicase PcrA